MSKLDDLHTLVRLLKEFEFPVSPILEYAIKEKIEQLSSQNENSVVVPDIDIQENDEVLEMSENTTPRAKRMALRITRSDGTIIECKKVASTFSTAIKEIGAEKVYLLKIPKDGMYLVSKGRNPLYESAQYDVGNGLFVNTHSSTKDKKRQLEKILNELNIHWTVEIV